MKIYKDDSIIYQKEAAKIIENLIDEAGWEYKNWDYFSNVFYIYDIGPLSIFFNSKSLYLPFKIRNKKIILKP